jgi:hypothetical protein
MKSRFNRAQTELAQLLSIEGPEDFEEDPIISAVIVARIAPRNRRFYSLAAHRPGMTLRVTSSAGSRFPWR